MSTSSTSLVGGETNAKEGASGHQSRCRLGALCGTDLTRRQLPMHLRPGRLDPLRSFAERDTTPASVMLVVRFSGLL